MAQPRILILTHELIDFVALSEKFGSKLAKYLGVTAKDDVLFTVFSKSVVLVKMTDSALNAIAEAAAKHGDQVYRYLISLIKYTGIRPILSSLTVVGDKTFY